MKPYMWLFCRMCFNGQEANVHDLFVFLIQVSILNHYLLEYTITEHHYHHLVVKQFIQTLDVDWIQHVHVYLQAWKGTKQHH